jgi:hypothetical protein
MENYSDFVLGHVDYIGPDGKLAFLWYSILSQRASFSYVRQKHNSNNGPVEMRNTRSNLFK